MNAIPVTWRADAQRARAQLARQLLAASAPSGAWEGELSSSALATAVAIAALHTVDPQSHARTVARGACWLRDSVNPDGGWGDSPGSRSNLSTTTLGWSALTLVGDARPCSATRAAAAWIERHAGGLAPGPLSDAVAAAYGRDRTFSAPILAVAALAGVLGPEPRCWRVVPQLPFECALMPHRLLSWARLPVVSYALPALIAIGLVRHRRQPARNPAIRALRDRATSAVLAKLARVQPESGGFLEATPLTAFVTMSLAACGCQNQPSVARGVAFLVAGQRGDGSWPIDSNLSTWLTTLSIKALGASGYVLPEARRATLLGWLLGQQLTRRHPFTQSAPGGFAWTVLPGGVPDADDTAGALLALHALDPEGDRTRAAALSALDWLFHLQNADGGIPTFCRGWGRLPFDRSCPDITAHALRAVLTWKTALRGRAAGRAQSFLRRALEYLAHEQRPDGAWLPLWFGNQWQPGGHSQVYGTAQVLLALGDAGGLGATFEARMSLARAWMLRAQNADGGWGCDAAGRSTIEETGLALAALAGRAPNEALARGARWLSGRVLAGEIVPAPIGLYFSSLWYAEKLYPLVFGLMGLGRVLGSWHDDAHADRAVVHEERVA